MRLVLDHLAAALGCSAHHGLGNIKAAAVIDADLGNHQRGMRGTNVSVSDFHVSYPFAIRSAQR